MMFGVASEDRFLALLEMTINQTSRAANNDPSRKRGGNAFAYVLVVSTFESLPRTSQLCLLSTMPGSWCNDMSQVSPR